MAVEDIYRVNVNFEGPTMASGCTIFYQEEVQQTTQGTATQSLAASWGFSKHLQWIGVLNNQWHLTSIHVHRVDGDPIAPFLATFSPTAGTRSGDPLPADNCLLIQLLQALYPRTSNGRLYLPGLSENDSTVGVVEASFLANQVVTLTNGLSSALPELSGNGVWIPGVISAKILNAPPDSKDWQAAFSPLIAAQGNPVIARQVRRRTKVTGVSVAA